MIWVGGLSPPNFGIKNPQIILDLLPQLNALSFPVKTQGSGDVNFWQDVEQQTFQFKIIE